MIRLARPSDINDVYRIYMDASVIPWLGHDPMTLDAFRAVFAKYLGAENFFVAERDGAVSRQPLRGPRQPCRGNRNARRPARPAGKRACT